MFRYYLKAIHKRNTVNDNVVFLSTINRTKRNEQEEKIVSFPYFGIIGSLFLVIKEERK